MKQLILLTAILLTSTVAQADDITTTETCEKVMGTVITGAVTGHKYCKSKNTMNWWNANSWCDGLGRRLFSLDDCEYSNTGTGVCNDLVGVAGREWVWAANPYSDSIAYDVNHSSGDITYYYRNYNGYYALCY